MSFLGKLGPDAIPYDPIVLATVAMMILGGIAVVAGITYFKKWGYLWNEWFTTVDHKKIGIMYLFVSIIMLLRGFADAIMMRLQLFLAKGGGEGYLHPEHYDQIFTAHGVIMIFFVAMGLVVGLMNISVPLQIGARDVAFPLLNSLSFWLFAGAAGLMMASLAIGEFAATGWMAYPPLSGIEYSPGVGVDYYIWALQISGLGTLLTGVNFFVTIIKMRAPGMSLMDMPIFTWTSLCTAVLIIASFPVLTATIAMLTLDRYFGFHFFTNDMGGSPMLYVNLIWTWGHPEVYILVLPAFGIYSEVVSTFSRKTLFGYKSMVYATIAITVLAFVVWLHHFFTMGAGANVNAFFGIMTMVIAIPTGVKIFSWLFTMYKGRITFTTPMLWTLGFLVTFGIGGLTGVLMAVPPADFLVHNSLFLIAHFHNVIIGGVVFGMFAGIIFYWPKMFGWKLNEAWGKAAFWFWFFGFYFAFMPLYILGFMGMTRRLNTYDNPEWDPYIAIAFFGSVLVAIGIACFVMQIVVGYLQRNDNLDLTGDPWDGRTLEWATSSPAPFYNFAHLPTINGIDTFWNDKENGVAYAKPTSYEDIHMPTNRAAGVVIAMFITVMGFGLIWHIWWLVVVMFIAAIISFIVSSFTKKVDYYVPAAEVERIENERYAILEKHLKKD
ncbi:cytochrome o ubiquinol oxidase subunit I [Acinetobacter johnsonii]|uniref:Cytochrome bo(3) ubiquinol oxidase subunit 1 n=1 Tax=Acinetobacter johnsonii TaxID=40214 RepID=A0AA42MSB0_ACIJO|nr:cytochrome o ubiquinol oxidase subunit I [Acinetobacter johnsonii]MDH0968862.1 cytochrome o ubiquinol oxidase subunit I [Acinetobacter johnsonii]QQT93493.1 cytochrome o ubiquinol oxidase subunit I [Acinetobacter johnsonii]